MLSSFVTNAKANLLATYTTSGSWITPKTGYYTFHIVGGGGGGSYVLSGYGGSGGAGGGTWIVELFLESGVLCTLTVGAGGNGSLYGEGGRGGTSVLSYTFGRTPTYIAAPGGVGGKTLLFFNTNTCVPGQTGISSSFFIPGGAGGAPVASSSNGKRGGAPGEAIISDTYPGNGQYGGSGGSESFPGAGGGASLYGLGGQGGNANDSAAIKDASAWGYGGGGGGGSSASTAGGNGAQGIILIFQR